jgi:hypothetical protein
MQTKKYLFIPESHNLALTLTIGSPIMSDDTGLFLKDGPCQKNIAHFNVNNGLIVGFTIDKNSAHLQTVKNVFANIL